jgi:hypothetical protein
MKTGRNEAGSRDSRCRKLLENAENMESGAADMRGSKSC